GITTNGGSVSPVENVNNSGAGSLTISNPIVTSNGDITLLADNLTVNAALNAGSGTVHFDTELPARPITVGTTIANTLSLLQSDLNQVTAGVLRIGDSSTDTAGLTVAAAISAPLAAPGTWNTLDLRNQ